MVFKTVVDFAIAGTAVAASNSPPGPLPLPDVALETLASTYGAAAKDTLMFGDSDRERVLVRPFFVATYDSIVISGWGVLEVSYVSTFLGVVVLLFLTAVTAACAKRTNAVVSMERRRCEPAGAISPE